jgi:hypothetical protein
MSCKPLAWLSVQEHAPVIGQADAERHVSIRAASLTPGTGC